MDREILTRIDGFAAYVNKLEPDSAQALAARRGDLTYVAQWATENSNELIAEAVGEALESVDKLLEPTVSVQDKLNDVAARCRALCDLAHALADAEAKPASTIFGEEFDQEIVSEFVTETSEQLAESEGHLLDLESDPGNLEHVNAIFRCFHTIKGLAGFLNLVDIESLAHAAEDLLDLVREEKADLSGQAADRVFDAIDMLKSLIGEMASGPPSGRNPRVAEMVAGFRSLIGQLETGEVPAAAPEASSAVAAEDSPASEPAAEAQSADEDADWGLESAADADAEPTAEEEAATAEAAPAAASGNGSSRPGGAGNGTGKPAGGSNGSGGGSTPNGGNDTIRVDSDRLDRLVDSIGELVITQSMVCRAAEQQLSGDRQLDRDLGRMEKITREIQELAGSLRMVELRATFRKMSRLARDVARKAGRRVDFKVVGEDTELDKAIVDRIGDPLVHLVRNAIDHGIESDIQDRVALGKPESGTVELRAFHRGGSIYVEIEDDGKGLDREGILKKGMERGLLREGETLSDRDVFRLICEPGFSMAKEITQLSGRGVGMDVVKRQIEAMGGTLEIRSERGKGSVFSMQLPLTLAVIDGMVIRVVGERYIVPTLSVVRLVNLQEEDILSVVGQAEVLRVQDDLITVLRVDELFALDRGDVEATPMALIAEGDGCFIALLIDEVLGQQQAVIKSIGEGIGETPGIAGCAIMSDGRVGLVMDVSGLQRLAAEKAIAQQNGAEHAPETKQLQMNGGH